MSGPVFNTQIFDIRKYSNTVTWNLSQNTIIQNQLTRFWQTEECSSVKPISQEEADCERHFAEAVSALKMEAS